MSFVPVASLCDLGNMTRSSFKVSSFPLSIGPHNDMFCMRMSSSVGEESNPLLAFDSLAFAFGRRLLLGHVYPGMLQD